MNKISTEQVVEYLFKNLDINKNILAGFIDIPAGTLSDLMGIEIEQSSAVSSKLYRIYEIVGHINSIYKSSSPGLVKEILLNGKIPVDFKEQEDGFIKLIQYATKHPRDKGWRANVNFAVADYINKAASVSTII